MTDKTRADDDHLLEIIRLRCFVGSGRIAQLYGVTSASIRVACNRVKNDDLKHSGEAAPVVLAGYWKD